MLILLHFAGYKLRQQIGKALQRRSEAIRNAITRYNEQAAKLNPPRPPLSWKEIVDYSFLGEFDLLRHSRGNVHQATWAQPARRAATVKYLTLHRGREEITRVNTEIRRLRTSIHDETVHVEGIIAELSQTDPRLCSELRRWWALRSSINRIHLWRLDKIESSPSYTGQRGIGVRLGARGNVDVDVANGDHMHPLDPAENAAIVDADIAEQEVLEQEQEAQRQYEHDLRNVTNFVLQITD
jgi:hypothetical protein